MATGGVVGCALLAGVGVYALFAGNMEKWKGIRKFYQEAFHKGQSPAPQENARKNFLEKLAAHPLLQKTLNNRVMKKIKQPLLATMAVESSIFTVIAAGTVIAAHAGAVVAAPLALSAGIIPIAIALKWSVWPVLSLVSVGKIVNRHFHKGLDNVKAKKAAAPAVKIVTPSSRIKNEKKPFAAIAKKFNRQAGKAAKQSELAPVAAPAAISSMDKLKIGL